MQQKLPMFWVTNIKIRSWYSTHRYASALRRDIAAFVGRVARTRSILHPQTPTQPLTQPSWRTMDGLNRIFQMSYLQFGVSIWAKMIFTIELVVKRYLDGDNWTLYVNHSQTEIQELTDARLQQWVRTMLMSVWGKLTFWSQYPYLCSQECSSQTVRILLWLLDQW